MYSIFRITYTLFFFPDRIMRKKTFGRENIDCKFLLIRPISENGLQGLASLFIQALRWVEYADKMGYVPFVDFENYKTQYHVDGINAWDLFFNQPSDMTLEELYKSKNVILSGVSLKKTIDETLFKNTVFFDNNLLNRCKRLLLSREFINKRIKSIVEEEAARLGVEDCIGVYIRGTDYVRLKPSGEYAQPSIESVISKVEEFKESYSDSSVFLVTEDKGYYERMSKKFGKDLRITSNDTFVENYDGNDFLYKTFVDNGRIIERATEYIVKIVLLSRCKYFVGTITNGSIISYCLNGGNYMDQYIFDMGYYK